MKLKIAKKFLKTLRKYQHKKAICRIREDMKFFGYPMDAFSDEDIEEAAIKFCKALTKTGISMNQATEAFHLLSKQLSGLERSLEIEQK